MTIHQLPYFCAVARTGNFTRAAVEEGVAQPSLSQQVVKLEKTLGAKLFDRLSRAYSSACPLHKALGKLVGTIMANNVLQIWEPVFV
jgi:hypothetical protein